MSSLPYEESDSENEYVVGQTPLQSPPQSPPEPNAAPITAPKVKAFQPPVTERRNATTPIPSDVRLVLATDLSSASYLDYISTISNAVEVINIQTLIQKDEPTKGGDKKQPAKPTTTTTPQKFIKYTLRLIPNTNTIIGFGDVEISPKYANFIAKALFPRENQFMTKITSILVLNAISIASLSANNQLYYHQQEQYPYFYQLNNFSRIAGVKSTTAGPNPESTPSTTTTTTSDSSSTSMVQFQPDPKTGEQIQVLPQTIGLGGLAAAIITWSTLYNIPCCAGLSIKNRAFPTELYVSFDKMCKLMNFQNGQNGQVPSMYGIDTSSSGAKVTIGMRNQAVKAILGLLEKKEAYSDRIIPHGKQDHSMSTASMFF